MSDLQARKDRLFGRLAGFLTRNTALVADTYDTNAPWALRAELDNYLYDEREARKAIRRASATVRDGSPR